MGNVITAVTFLGFFDERGLAGSSYGREKNKTTNL